MSTNIVSIIPTDPFWVPGAEAAEVARAILARIYPGPARWRWIGMRIRSSLTKERTSKTFGVLFATATC